MAVNSGWVGSSAKAETGKAWMGDARVALRLPRAGWMSEMVGRSVEIRYVNTVNRTQANIHTLMGSPTVASVYIFENTATISAASRSGWALQTGAFPAGSTLRIINRGSIRGGGGNGGSNGGNGAAGGSALVLNFPTTIDNTSGSIWGGGGGGGGGSSYGGGGGAGTPAGVGGAGSGTGNSGTATAGGAARGSGTSGSGAGGGLGGAGAAGGRGAGGRGGYSVQRNGNAVSWIAAGDRRGAVV